MMKIVSVVGARPQFIKAAAVSRAMAASGQFQEVMVHTGQHFDGNMSDIFFSELEIPKPKYNLRISGGHHGAMTGRMLESIESVLMDERPAWVLIYGDTNSTLAGALAASKLHYPVAHVEAGLRSFNNLMPEEINRILADRVSTLLLCPTEIAVRNLYSEGITAGVSNVGDVMHDVALHYRDKARESSTILEELGLAGRPFILATCHRAENTDDPTRLHGIIKGLSELAQEVPVVLPLHPRTSRLLGEEGREALGQIRTLQPLSYIDMVALEQAARVIATDSGGVQKEAFFYNVPCVTMRDETEWVETVELGMNVLVGASSDRIVAECRQAMGRASVPQVSAPYGAGRAAEAVISTMLGHA